jgi:alpha-tubulin suppressor-like RCC1 family protein
MTHISLFRSVAARTSSRCRRFRRASFTFGATAFLVTVLGCQEDVTTPTPPEPAAVLATTAGALAFYQVSAGNLHSCGVTTDNRAYCWGYNESGQLGTGTNIGPESCDGAVGPFACSRRPAPVAGGLRFHQVSAGSHYSCGVTTDFRAYCWGSNSFGQLGDGTGTDRPAPVPVVAGGRRFTRVDAGFNHTCAVSYPENRAYCWGTNSSGQLGDGTTTTRRTQVAVSGTLGFREVSVGDFHTCGVTTDNRAFCWGANDFGQIGDSSTARRRLTPTRVAGARQFRQLDTGNNHACAVTTDRRAYCWGNGREGQIGNGKAYLSFWPRAVAGGLFFDRVSAARYHTCGETTSDRAYCWGSNSFGRLGDGTTTQRLKPVAVAGGLNFAQLSAGSDHTCGKSSTNVGYCWGYNFFAQLGDGTNTNRSAPSAVAAPS